MDSNINKNSDFLTVHEIFSPSQFKMLTNTEMNDSHESPFLNTTVFGPKLSSIINRLSLDFNYKPIHHSDSIDSFKSKQNRISFEINNISNNLKIDNSKCSNSNSLNCTKNNIHIETSDPNYSENDSFRNFAMVGNENKLATSSEFYSKKYERYLDNIYFNLFITLITIYALFGNDIQAACFTLNSDIYFDVCSIISMGAFLIEIILSFFMKKGYRFSFFFWLDIISTISLLFDVTWIQDVLFMKYFLM